MTARGKGTPPPGRAATGALALGVGTLLFLPLTGLDRFFLDVLTVGFLLAAFAGTWDLVGGLAGQITLGHALFFGIATYSTALLTSLAGWSFAAAAVAALLFCAAAGAAVGALAARMTGPFVALFTLALGELAHEAVLGQTLFSPGEGYSWGGEGGIPVVLPWRDPSPWVSYYGAFAFLLLSTGILLWIARSKRGLVWKAIAGSELTARASGVDVSRRKMEAFLLGGILAGAAGIGFAAHVGRATAGDLSLELSFQAAAFAAIGGRGTIAGPVAASFLLHILLQGTGVGPPARVLLYALALLAVLRFFPSGVAGTLRERALARRMGTGGTR